MPVKLRVLGLLERDGDHGLPRNAFTWAATSIAASATFVWTGTISFTEKALDMCADIAPDGRQLDCRGTGGSAAGCSAAWRRARVTCSRAGGMAGAAIEAGVVGTALAPAPPAGRAPRHRARQRREMEQLPQRRDDRGVVELVSPGGRMTLPART